MTNRGAVYDLRLRTIDGRSYKRIFARDECIVRVHLEPAIGRRRLRTITAAELLTLVKTWTEHLKPRTVRRQFGVVRAVFRFAVERDYLGRSPCRSIKLPEVEHTTRPVVVAAVELERLAQALGPDHAPMAYLGAVLGLRWASVQVCASGGSTSCARR